MGRDQNNANNRSNDMRIFTNNRGQNRIFRKGTKVLRDENDSKHKHFKQYTQRYNYNLTPMIFRWIQIAYMLASHVFSEIFQELYRLFFTSHSLDVLQPSIYFQKTKHNISMLRNIVIMPFIPPQVA